MTTFINLPTEIRLLIAQNLSESEIFGIRLLNSFFFNYWMDIRWREAMVDTDTPNFSVRALQRAMYVQGNDFFEFPLIMEYIYRDPFVATRLRGLSIRVLPLESKPQESELKFDTALSAFINSLPLLPNITSLKIYSLSSRVTNYIETISSSSIAGNLQDLTLTGPLEMFDWLWEYSAHGAPFPNLNKLSLDHYGHTSKKKRKREQKQKLESSLCLEHFLRSVAPTLQYLRIHTGDDLSPLFNVLLQHLSGSDSIFPNLKFLILRLHSNRLLPSSPQAVHRFFLTHNSLHLLHLELLKTARLTDTWLADLVNNNGYQLPSLQTLNACINPTDTQMALSPLLSLIKKAAPTLTSLTVSSHYLRDEEAQSVLDAVTEGKIQAKTTTEEPRKLKSLSIYLRYLSVSFLDLLATKFPELERLSLRPAMIFGSKQVRLIPLLLLFHTWGD